MTLAVMRKTNPSKIRSEARTLEIKARMDGKPVLAVRPDHAEKNARAGAYLGDDHGIL